LLKKAALRHSGEVFRDRIPVGVLPRSDEVDQRKPSMFVQIFSSFGEVTSSMSSLRLGSDSFGFKLIRQGNQPSLYFDVTGHQRKLMAFLDLIAQPFRLRHPASPSPSTNFSKARPNALSPMNAGAGVVVAAVCLLGIAIR
jgi:hypothetical protein